MEKDYILEINNIDKIFHIRKVLDDLSLKIERATVHGLVGENGAGKSTLINIIAGLVKADSGTIFFDNEKCEFKTPNDARIKGISVIHQEIKLAEPLTVWENIFLGNFKIKNHLVDVKGMQTEARKMIQDLGMDIDVLSQVSTLPVAKKQIVEILHALTFNSKLIIMDEPSAILTNREIDILFGIIRNLKNKGVTIIYISHRLDEIVGLCDNITILRDGKHIGTFPTKELTKNELIKMMVGRELECEYPKEKAKIGDTVLEVKNLSTKMLKDISLYVKSGEVFGISGLVGSGRTELIKAILGIDKTTGGEVYIRGKKKKYKNFQSAINDGLGLIPEDRKSQGAVQIMSIKNNIPLANLDRIIRNGSISSKIENESGKGFIDKLKIACNSADQEVFRLSGGNQQKVVIAKWLFRESDILFLDEPTRGVDIGAKYEIYKLINEMTKDGKAVVLISSEMQELLGMCDRIMVMHEGKKVGEFSSEDATQEKIMALCV